MRVCTKIGNRRERCRRPRRARATGRQGTARITATQSEGWAAPLIPAIGRFWLNAGGHCSGTLIGPSIILTAAHCLYVNPSMARDYGLPIGYFQHQGTMQFTPGSTWLAGTMAIGGDANLHASGTVSPQYGVFQVINSWVPAGWTQDDGRYDYGFAQVEGAPGNSVGWFDAWADLGASPGEWFYWSGYPGAGVWNSFENHYGNGQYFCEGTWDGVVAAPGGVVGTGVYLEKTGCPMSGGSSGGPVFKFTASGWLLNGVNNAGRDDGDGFSSEPNETNDHNYFDSDFITFYRSLFG